MDSTTLLIVIVVLVLLFGGGGGLAENLGGPGRLGPRVERPEIAGMRT